MYYSFLSWFWGLPGLGWEALPRGLSCGGSKMTSGTGGIPKPPLLTCLVPGGKTPNSGASTAGAPQAFLALWLLLPAVSTSPLQWSSTGVARLLTGWLMGPRASLPRQTRRSCINFPNWTWKSGSVSAVTHCSLGSHQPPRPHHA